MNFSSMDYFVMVAQERSFTKAAQRLHITQQTLSAHIAALEQELGSQLLIRHVPLELTYAGQVFLQYASEFQKRRRTMEQEFLDIAQQKKGLLRIGIANTRGHAIMPGLIDGFQKQYPQIGIRLLEESNDVLRQRLLDRAIDLAIANFPETLPGIEMENFYREEIVLLMSDCLFQEIYGGEGRAVDGALNAGDMTILQDCPFLLNSPQDIAGRIGRGLLFQAGVIPRGKVESSNIETLLDLCVRGIGACFCPGNLAKATLSEAQAAHMHIFHFSEDACYDIRFGYLKQTYHWSAILNFIEFCKQAIPEYL